MTFDTLLNSEVDIYTRTATTNALGEKIYSWAVAYQDVDCRLSPLTAEEMMIRPGEWTDVKYKAWFSPDTTITTNDRIYSGSNQYVIREVLIDSESQLKRVMLAKL